MHIPNIRIVSDNDFYLMVKVKDDDGYDVNFSNVSDLTLHLLYNRSGIIKPRTPPYFVMHNDPYVIVVRCTDLPMGEYGIEILYRQHTLRLCARQMALFAVVYSNIDSRLQGKDYIPSPKPEEDKNVLLSGLFPQVLSSSLGQIAELSGVIVNYNDQKRIITFCESDWESIKSNSTALAIFCEQFDGWLVVVTEDYDEYTWTFGESFPLIFAQEDWSFGDYFPLIFSTDIADPVVDPTKEIYSFTIRR